MIIFELQKSIMSKSKYVLITGGTGFIGSHTVVALHALGYQPILLDNLSNSERSVLDALEKISGERFPFFEGDCRDASIYKRIFAEFPFEAVIHFAAFKAVGESVEKPLLYFDNNINSTIVLMQAMDKLGIKNLIFSSSCTVYGNPESKMVTESSPLQKPESPYGYTKLVCEEMIQTAVQLKQNFSAVLLRYFNPIGAHESGLIGENPIGVPNNLVPYITQTAKGIREKLSVFGNDYPTSDGTCVRDYIHVMDVAEAHVAALQFIENQTEIKTHVFNIGTGKGTSVLEAISCFQAATETTLNWQFAPRRSGDVAEIFANTDLAKQKLNWSSKRDITQAMKDAWRWEQNNK
jgi:UDP-glucose 4-epimerase